MSDETITRVGLSLRESRLISDMVAGGKVVVTITDFADAIGSGEKARKFASRLSKKGWLKRISKGIYLILDLAAGSKPEWTEDSFYIASRLVEPGYVAYCNALNYYGWTEQVPLSVFVATTKKLRSRSVSGVDYRFVTLSKKKFFGFSQKFVRGREVSVSDPEKTLADALDHPEYCGGPSEVAKALVEAAKTVDWEKFVGYLEKMGNGAAFKRFGYLVELLGISVSNALMNRVIRRVTAGYSPLFSGAKLAGKRNAKWNLVLNASVSPIELLQ